MPEDDVDDTETTETEEQPKTGGMKKIREERDTFLADKKRLERENALLRAGLGELGAVREKALLAAHDGELTADGLRGTAVALGFVEPPEEPDPQQAAATAAAAAQTRIADTSNGAGPSLNNSVLTAEEVSSWDDDKRLRLWRDHPDEFQALMRGEQVTGIQFT